MDKVLNFKQGRVPLLISMPHAGLRLTPVVEEGLIPDAKSLPDTDWHIPGFTNSPPSWAPAPWQPSTRGLSSI